MIEMPHSHIVKYFLPCRQFCQKKSISVLATYINITNAPVTLINMSPASLSLCLFYFSLVCIPPLPSSQFCLLLLMDDEGSLIGYF